MNISFGICKNVCVVQNKTVTISDKSDVSYLALDKHQKSKNRIKMITSLGRSNKCKIKKMTDKEYQITFENPLMKNSALVSGALVDYQGSSWIIQKQSFYPELGKVEALLQLKDNSNKDIDKEMVRISHEEGLPVNVWTVNEKYEMLRMIEYGVDGIITDYPLRLKKLCENEGVNWY